MSTTRVVGTDARMRALAVVALLVAMVLALVGAAADAASPAEQSHYDLSWHVVAGGGGQGSSGGYALGGTAGQPAAGLSGESPYILCSGFWCGAAAGGYRIYLPAVLRGTP
jgi:hypothetical protein